MKPSEARQKKPVSARDQTLDSIRSGNVKSALKPAAERELAPKKVPDEPSSLGDVLMLAMSRRRVALKAEKKQSASAKKPKSVLDDSDDDDSDEIDETLPEDVDSSDDWDV